MSESRPSQPGRPAPQLVIKVVETAEEMSMAVAVRVAVYMGECGLPYRFVQDGNEFTATHVLALVDGEPVASMRIRYFGEFAFPEKLAVLPAWRLRRVGGRILVHAVGRYAFDFCRQKGFRQFYGQSLTERVKYWERIGDGRFKTFGEPFERHGHTVHGMIGTLDRPPDWLGFHSEPEDLVAPEGRIADPQSGARGPA